MFRPITAPDERIYLQMADAFYHSEAVAHPVPPQHYARTFQALMAGTPFAACYIFELEDRIAGYALLALTWSQEAGGLTVWVDELFVLPQFRGRGLGRAFFDALPTLYPSAARFRLEIEPDNHRAEALYRRMGYDFLPYRQMIVDIPLPNEERSDKI